MPPASLPTKSHKLTINPQLATSVEHPILPIDDIEEAVWTYVQYSRTPKTALEQAAAKIGAFKPLSSWKRRVLRLIVKDGSCTMTVAEDEESLKASTNYELARVVDIRWLTVPEEESLAFAATASMSAMNASGIIYHGNNAMGGGGGGGADGDGDDIFGDGSGGHNTGPNSDGSLLRGFPAARMASYQYVYGQIAFSVLILNAMYLKAYDASGDDREQMEALLSRPEVCTVVSFAFGSTKEAESWYEWFAEFILLRERAMVENKDVDTALSAAASLPHPPVFQLTPTNLKAVKEYVHLFLKSGPKGIGGALGSRFLWGTTGPPNDGRLRCKPPSSSDYASVFLTGNYDTGELFFAKGHKSAVMRVLNGGVNYSRRIVLSKTCRIMATSAFGTEFVVDMTPITSYAAGEVPLADNAAAHYQQGGGVHLAGAAGATAASSSPSAVGTSLMASSTFGNVAMLGTSGTDEDGNSSVAPSIAPTNAPTVITTGLGANFSTHNHHNPSGANIPLSRNTWSFLCKSVKIRNGFIEWLRLVKGRGLKAQTEEESYPFTISARDDLDLMYPMSSGGGGAGFNGGMSSAMSMFDGSESMAGTLMQDRQSEDTDFDREDSAGGGRSGSPSSARKKVIFNTKVTATDVDEERKKREEEEYLALYPSHEPSSCGSSVDSGYSCREFRYFPSYYEVTVLPYIDAQLIDHLQGRPTAVLKRLYPPGQVPAGLGIGGVAAGGNSSSNNNSGLFLGNGRYNTHTIGGGLLVGGGASGLSSAAALGSSTNRQLASTPLGKLKLQQQIAFLHQQTYGGGGTQLGAEEGVGVGAGRRGSIGPGSSSSMGLGGGGGFRLHNGPSGVGVSGRRAPSPTASFGNINNKTRHPLSQSPHRYESPYASNKSNTKGGRTASTLNRSGGVGGANAMVPPVTPAGFFSNPLPLSPEAAAAAFANGVGAYGGSLANGIGGGGRKSAVGTENDLLFAHSGAAAGASSSAYLSSGLGLSSSGLTHSRGLFNGEVEQGGPRRGHANPAEFLRTLPTNRSAAATVRSTSPLNYNSRNRGGGGGGPRASSPPRQHQNTYYRASIMEDNTDGYVAGQRRGGGGSSLMDHRQSTVYSSSGRLNSSPTLGSGRARAMSNSGRYNNGRDYGLNTSAGGGGTPRRSAYVPGGAVATSSPAKRHPSGGPLTRSRSGAMKKEGAQRPTAKTIIL